MSSEPSPCLWELPDVIIFHIVTFVAPPTERATVLCHDIAQLCHASYRAVLLEEERSLWDMVLQEDYGAVVRPDNAKMRASKRLRRSAVHRVREAHTLIKDNTEIAFYYLSEMTSTSRNGLTRAKLCRLLEEYGPHLRINHPVASGGLYLVEVCRARNVKEAVILKCVQELVENYGALVDRWTNESKKSGQTALAVAAVRAMPTVVQYVMSKGRACREQRSSGRFGLNTKPKKTLQCINATPVEFAVAMRNAEREAGATKGQLGNLEECIRILRKQM
jgi:hypothetical protein